PTPGSGDFCLISAEPLDKVIADLEAAGVEIEVPASKRTGALGPMMSVYFRDPDGNLVEISEYA
ncbi:MAG: VOC family protein, partial [Proteobacteria bacterium]|nr:VOC family protein [Pseudomonadota bacterium]